MAFSIEHHLGVISYSFYQLSLFWKCNFSRGLSSLLRSMPVFLTVLVCSFVIIRPLAENLILIGGTINIPGFAARLLEELDSCLTLCPFTDLSALKGRFKIHQPPGEPNYIAWLGGMSGLLYC